MHLFVGKYVNHVNSNMSLLFILSSMAINYKLGSKKWSADFVFKRIPYFVGLQYFHCMTKNVSLFAGVVELWLE